MEQRRRILFVDAYDSFTANVIGLLERSLDADIHMVHMDDKPLQANLKSVLKSFDAVVVGPGPGHPSNPVDAGIINDLYQLGEDDILPVLGICLGFQALGLAYGAAVTRLVRPRHGIVSEVAHNDEDIFANIGKFSATNYHSLKVDLGDVDDSVLVPLAWDINDTTNGPVLMGMRHADKPFWGVQFHPESICTSEKGAEHLVANWWALANEWSKKSSRAVSRDSSFLKILDPNAQLEDTAVAVPEANGHVDVAEVPDLLEDIFPSATREKPFLTWQRYSATHITPERLCEILRDTGDGEEVVLLDSQGHPTGRYSILGCVDRSRSTKVLYNAGDHTLKYGVGSDREQFKTLGLRSIDEAWPILENTTSAWAPCNAQLPQDVPFWGGFMGYISYEAGLETIDVPLPPAATENQTPDINMVFVHRSIVIDHSNSSAYVQSLFPNDERWLRSVGNTLTLLTSYGTKEQGQGVSGTINAALEKALGESTIVRPTKDDYSQKLESCQQTLAAGDSYELCLTDATKIYTPPELDSWDLYKKLRARNAAPFGAFLHLNDVTVVGSSPERFLKWDRSGQVEFRPIKGTVKKTPTTTYEDACTILNSSKEQAENLMIVDLIRHDLSTVVGASNCWVSQLMVIEEYEHVYQLVSAINGRLPLDKHGIEVLRASLPPGSMTGAPKKRSCEVLCGLEQRPRGVYAGVLGYLDVGGSGDFSVVIRTAFKSGDSNVWQVGAGGAVTVQSDIDGEFNEMQTKASSVLGAMTPVAV